MKWTLARFLGCVVVLLAKQLVLPLQARGEADLTIEISDRAASTLKRFATESAEWRTEIELPGVRTVYRVNVLKEQDRMRFAGYAVPPDAEPVPLFRLFVVSNTWHVVEADSRVKCRPWEHYFQFPVAELLLEACELRFLHDSAAFMSLTALETNKTSIIFQEGLGSAESNRLARLKIEVDATLGSSQKASTRRARQQMDFVGQMLAHGRQVHVDRSNGFLAQWETQHRKITTSNFRWLGSTQTNRIRVSATNYTDLTNPFRGVDWKRCVIVAHDPSAVGGSNPVVDPRIGVLQLEKGIITRLPVPAIGGLSACFLAGRTNVLTVYQDVAGVSGLGLIDLGTGAFTGIELDSEALFIGPPVMSPDNKTAALLCRRENAQSVLQFQLLLLDLGKWTLTPLGKPGSLGGPYSWLPDGSGIVMKRFLPADMDAVQPRMLCVMRLDGTLTDIGMGDMPLVALRQQLILHEGENRAWYLSDLTGKRPRKYSDGMKGYGSPAISPDGKEVLWLQFSSDELPKLWLFPFEGARAKPVAHIQGFVGHPVW